MDRVQSKNSVGGHTLLLHGHPRMGKGASKAALQFSQSRASRIHLLVQVLWSYASYPVFSSAIAVLRNLRVELALLESCITL